jgi:hypothetical protein
MIPTFLMAFAAAVSWFSASAFAAEPGRVEFEIFRNGVATGIHRVDVSRAGETAIAKTTIQMAGRIGPIAYAYSHQCTEVWRATALQSLACTDKQNDKPATNVRLAAPGLGLPSSWWRYDLMRQTQMIDTRTGKVTPIVVERIGQETVTTASGPVLATRYRLRGTSAADIWYDAQGRWVKLTFRLRGQNFEYRQRSALSEVPRV